MVKSNSWKKIFSDFDIHNHNFYKEPFYISTKEIKQSCQGFTKANEKESYILCKQDTRESRPDVFKENGLFLLPVKNGHYAIIKGEGYVDIPPIEGCTKVYKSKLDFALDTVKVGDSEMQHLDYAYAASLIRTFAEDPSLVLTIRGRKYTPEFSFKVGTKTIQVSSVQTEVDAGYEGKEQVVLIEAKNFSATNVVIRQLYYPFRQWQKHTNKKVRTLFFDKELNSDIYSIWQFEFDPLDDYNGIKLMKSQRFQIVDC